ncbi:hypothetical protein LPN04_31285 [Rugamonas sp. A1-17]|nr:hypothetical protein [Rugamonas sp. A1-17]
MSKRIVKVGPLQAILMVALLPGCANLQPYVLPTIDNACMAVKDSKDSKDDIDNPCSKVPSLVAAVTSIEKSTLHVASNLGGDSSSNSGEGSNMSATAMRKTLDFTTFALITALGIKAAHNTAGSATKNLGLAAAASYAASTLYGSPTTESIYMATHNNLICIADKGNGMLTGYLSAAKRYSQLEVRYAEVQTNSICSSDVPGDPGKAALVARAGAFDALGRVQASDAEIGEKLRSASNNLLGEMNRQLLANSPSIDAITKAARSSSSLASSWSGGVPTLPPAATSTPTPPPAGADGKDPTVKSAPFNLDLIEPKVCVLKIDDLVNAKSQYDAVTATIAGHLNAIGDLAKGCATEQVLQLKPLAVSMSSIDVIGGKTVTVEVSGGRPPYSTNWVGTPPDAGTGVSADIVLGTSSLKVVAPAGVEDGKFSLKVLDASVVANSVPVAVAVYKAK